MVVTPGSERVTGFEPAPNAWKAHMQPLHHTRVFIQLCCKSSFLDQSLVRESNSHLRFTRAVY